MRFGLLLIGGAVAVTGFIGLALLSAASGGAGSSLGVLVSCAPTLPPDDEKDENSESDEQSSNT